MAREERYSLCCGARPLGELYEHKGDYSGRCSRCKEGSGFYTEAELDEMDEPTPPNQRVTFKFPEYM